MEYHMVDERWTLFGFETFESYLESLVVKGFFNPKVPTDVVSEYKSVEYMMAHAYYYYPLYHEAFSKVLRIIEMSVKLRCSQRNISLTNVKTRKGKEYLEKRVLKNLMDDLIQDEPHKELGVRFEIARTLRNSLMHPDRHENSGALSRGYIIQAINLLNTLFLDEDHFVTIEHELKQATILLEQFREGVFVFKVNETKYLVKGVQVAACIFLDEKWEYLVVGMPIMLNPLENLLAHRYLEPLAVTASALICADDELHIVDKITGQLIFVTRTEQIENLEVYDNYLKAEQTLAERDRLMYLIKTENDIDKLTEQFWYEKLRLIK